jgi:hypothetical protein
METGPTWVSDCSGEEDGVVPSGWAVALPGHTDGEAKRNGERDVHGPTERTRVRIARRILFGWKKIIYISDINYCICILSYILILDEFSNHIFLNPSILL